MTRSAFHVLQSLDDVSETSVEVLSPAVIAYNLDYSQTNIHDKLAELKEAGLVDKIEKGRYRITDKGRAYLDGEIEPEELEFE